MTSKEALEDLVLYLNANEPTGKFVENVKTIKEDLEMLEIYKIIDEQIGVDYITLNKLRQANKIYVRFNKKIQEYNRFKIDLRECKILYGYIKGKGYCLQEPLSNYNKGFSLQKEVFDNDKTTT